eukprot:CAMPEP_0184516576 /NCGR_PEP_ID=MMETSP0198_2-20121128/5105_1 /TAXON_ID=1112570 /ORGANISM="Thraustochytrium sp., Strain LLF1b" /LENGTH=357 /DNA_ID=CAMNT_0026906911 /DNA_START=89 /DNA_END=1163 /DNA_ORIENTATION=+
MLGRVTRLLAENLSKQDRQGLVKSLEPGIEASNALVSKIREELEQAKSAVAALETEKSQLEEKVNVEAERFRSLKEEHLGYIKKKTDEERLVRKETTHPIYGKLLYDFGYKRVFASEPKRLTDKVVLPVWEKQRIFRPERAKAIAKYKNNDDRFGFPGAICVFDLDEPDKRGIVDGQHRIGGLELLLKDNVVAEDKLVLTEVYRVADGLEEVGDLFKEINQAQPALEVDLPGAAEEHITAAIDNVSKILSEEYSAMFRPSLRCRAPHMNVDILRQELFESEKALSVIRAAPKQDEETATETLLEWVRAQNARLARRSMEEWQASSMLRVKSQKHLQSGLGKSTTHDFFLGMDLSWLS